jgi:hypothetical protein
MSTISAIQPSFAAGELSPFLYGRVDLAKFHVGCRTLQNFFVHPHGGASNRPGMRFVGEVDDSTTRHRLIPFQFRTLPAGQTYALLFGDLTMQVVMNGGFVLDAMSAIYTLATPYAFADLPLLKFVQSADTMTLTHPSYAPQKLTRTGHAAWTLTPITFAPSQIAPATVPGSGYQITALNDATGEESLPSVTTGTLSWTALAGCTNYFVYKKSGTGNIFGFIGQAIAPSSGGTVTFTDTGLTPDVGNTPPQQRNPFGGGPITNITGFPTGSGYVAPTATFMDPSGTGASVTLTVSGGAITGFTGLVGGLNYTSPTISIKDGTGSGAAIVLDFVDDGLGQGTYTVSSATVTAGGSGYHSGATAAVYYGGLLSAYIPLTIAGGVITAANAVGLFGNGLDITLFAPVSISDSAGSGAALTAVVTAGNNTNPQCSGYYLQRQGFAGTLAMPQTLWFSDVGAFNNMAVSTPTKDSDAITRTLVGQQVNEIRHLVPVGTNLMLMTSGAEWRCWPGPNASALTPAACFTLPQTAHGSSHVPPIWTQNSLLFVKEKGSRVVELRYDAIQDLYQSFDMSVLAQHLLYDTSGQFQIQEWALAYEPYQIIWGVRSDGVLLGFTFMREHEVYAWHRHLTQGTVESVCSITEPDGSGGYFDAVYLIVARTVGGVTRRYVERMAPRIFATIADAWFLDCALLYDGAPVTTVSGLDHLEGMTVGILGDGSVVPDQVVTGGSVTLDGSYSKVLVGLRYSAQLETLNLELPANGTMQGQMKKIAQVTVRVKESRGLQVGLVQQALQEVKQRSAETLGSAMQPFSGDWAIQVPSEWNRDGRIFCQQMYPLPATILDLIPEVSLGA